MRVWFPHLIVAALVLVVAVLVVTSLESEARRYILTDGFNGVDGSAPDTSKWEVEATGVTKEVYVRDGVLHTDMNSWDMARARMLNDFVNENITMKVEFKIERDEWRPIEIVYFANAGSIDYIIVVYYDQEGWSYMGDTGSYDSGIRNVQVGHWYEVEFNVSQNVLDFYVRDKANNQTIWSFEDLQLAVGIDRHHFTIGVRSLDREHLPSTVWDNFTLYDPYMDPNTLPQWVDMPHLLATEDTVLVHDFTDSVQDDQPKEELAIDSPSEYVHDISGLTLSFLFPNNVTETAVTLILSDGYAEVPYWLTIQVTPVNDPPEHAIPAILSATEGVRTTIDLSPYVWDMDNDKAELWLDVDDPYVQGSHLELIATFPEGMRYYNLTIGIDDGTVTVWVGVHFMIKGTNNPPTISTIETLFLTEDVPYEMDLADYVWDPDDDLEHLTIAVDSSNCEVDGTILIFLYERGDTVDVVILRVSDGFGTVDARIEVRVKEVNDPPLCQAIPTVLVDEGELYQLDLGPYIWDEESIDSLLELSCVHPNVVTVMGLVINLRYDHWADDHRIWFNVSDGWNVTNFSFFVQVNETNSPPTIMGIEGLSAPYTIRMPEGLERAFKISAKDPDDINLRFSIDSIWRGFRIFEDQLVVTAIPGDAGYHTCYINVFDLRGGTDRVKVTAKVVEPSMMNIELFVTYPHNNSYTLSGEVTLFRVVVSDPDGYFYGPITVIWVSDETGELDLVETASDHTYAYAFPDGLYVLTVFVSDGVLTVSESMTVQVGDVSTDGEPDTGVLSIVLISIISIVIVLIVIGLIIAVASASRPKGVDADGSEHIDDWMEAQRSLGRKKMEEEDRKGEEARQAELEREVRLLEERRMEDQRKAAAERRFLVGKGPPAPPEPPRPYEPPTIRPPEPHAMPKAITRPGGTLPTEAEMEGNIVVLRSALDALPGGLPSDLALYGTSTVAGRIVKGRKKWSPDGRLLAFVQGDWYYVDPNDPHFMGPFEE